MWDVWRKRILFYIVGASLVAQKVKNLPAMQETWDQSLDREDPLEKGMATTPVFLPGKYLGQYVTWWAIVHGVMKSQA